MFIDEIVVNDLLPRLLDTQWDHQEYIHSLQLKYPLTFLNDTWTYQNHIVVAENNDLRWGLSPFFMTLPQQDTLNKNEHR
jgi:hypothetical protein